MKRKNTTNHHYIWRFYLNNWATDKTQKKKKISVYNIDNQTLCSRDTRTTGFAKQLYRIGKLSEEDISYLRLIADIAFTLNYAK